MADGSGESSSSGLFGQRDPVFRPWPLPGRGPSNIAEFVQQLKTQGIEFRNLSEEGLRKEIEEQQKKEDEGQDVDDAPDGVPAESKSGGDADALDDKPKGMEAMIAKRDEILMTLESAVQNGLIVVDFVSLLLSKDRPTQAMQTLSSVLRDKVGIGTLSAGRIANAAQAARALQNRNSGGGGGGAISAAERQALDETTRSNAQRLLDHKTECVGWQLLAMDRASEMLEAGRKRLHAELRREQTYWSEVLAVRDRGWGLSRVPGQRRVLRVKFGFSESAPDLRTLGFAPLRRVKRGHVALDMSALGPPSTVVVTLRRREGGTEETGRSSLSARLPATARLEDRILEARNTIYAKELWRELNREARQMVSHGVAFRNSEIVFPAGAHTEGVIALEPLRLGKDQKSGSGRNPVLNDLAETICLSLHLFLSHGHREHYRQRSMPAPPSDTVAAPPAYFMLRPIVANLKYEKAITHMSGFLSDLCSILHGVGQTGARFTLFERPLSSYLPPPPDNDTASATSTAARSGQQQSSSEGLCTGFLAPREFSFELSINPHTRLLIRSRTTVTPLKTQYLIQLLPPSTTPSAPPQPNLPQIKNWLLDSFPPADNYGTLRDVIEYISDATAHTLAAHARNIARDWETKSGTGAAWSTSVDGMEIHQLNNAFWTLRFSVVPKSAVTELDTLVALERDSDKNSHSGNKNKSLHVDIDDDKDEYVDTSAPNDTDQDDANARNIDSPLARPSAPELRVYASWPLQQAEAAVHRKWVWSAESLQQADASSIDLLETVIQGSVSGTLKPQANSQAK